MSRLYFFTAESYQEAGDLLERGIALDPSYAQAHAYLAWWLNFRIGEGWSHDRDADRARALIVSQRAIEQVETAHRLGAAGFKEYKRLGLYLRDGKGELIKIDDPKLDGVWRRCGELGLPVSIHVTDPRAFWLPSNPQNERWR